MAPAGTVPHPPDTIGRVGVSAGTVSASHVLLQTTYGFAPSCVHEPATACLLCRYHSVIRGFLLYAYKSVNVRVGTTLVKILSVGTMYGHRGKRRGTAACWPESIYTVRCRVEVSSELPSSNKASGQTANTASSVRFLDSFHPVTAVNMDTFSLQASSRLNMNVVVVASHSGSAKETPVRLSALATSQASSAMLCCLLWSSCA